MSEEMSSDRYQTIIQRERQLRQVLDILLYPYSDRSTSFERPWARNPVTVMGDYPVVITYQYFCENMGAAYTRRSIVFSMKYWDKVYMLEITIPIYIENDSDDTWEAVLFDCVVPDIKATIQKLLSVVKVRQMRIAQKNIPQYAETNDDIIKRIYPEVEIFNKEE